MLGQLRDRLGFTPAEVKAIVLLSAALLLGQALRSLELIPARDSPGAGTDFDYRALDSLFLARSAALRDSARSPAPRATQDKPHPVNINTADESELASLPGIGPAYAHRILVYRQNHGPFRSVDDLLAVRGIGPKRLAALRPLLRLD